MSPLHDYLTGSSGEKYKQRRWMFEWARFLPPFLGKHITRAILPKSFEHMRELDAAFTFDRQERGLSAMRFKGTKITDSVPTNELMERITRPVTLVTTGPSALNHDWEAEKKSGRMIVAVTGGAGFLKERGIVPELLILSDPGFCKTGGYHIRDAIGIPLVLEYRCAAALEAYFPGAFLQRRVSIVERVNRWYGLPPLSKSELQRMNKESKSPFRLGELAPIGWSDCLDLGFFPSSTVAIVALQVLVALGATDIEIIGMDLGGTHSVYGNARPSRLEQNYESIILPSFIMMKSALSNRGIKIRNVSPSCPLPPELFKFS